MAVQIPDPGTGNGQTGDNEYVFRKKVRDNFSDQNNAASREVGGLNGNVVEVKNGSPNGMGWGTDEGVYNEARVKWDEAKSIAQNVVANSVTIMTGWDNPTDKQLLIDAKGGASAAGTIIRFGYGQSSDSYNFLFKDYGSFNLLLGMSHKNGGATTEWRSVIVDGANKIYQKTTALGANVSVDSNGFLYRSTSSERYKNIIAPLELDDAAYANAMQLAPIVYRSTADADNPDYHYYSFSAEQLGAHDPAFTLWRETETITDDDGNVTEQPLEERVAEGLNLNAIVAFLHATNIKQGKMIADLERRLSALEPTPEV